MSFPSIAATATSAKTSGFTLSVSMPSGIVAGNLLLVFYSHDTAGDITQSGGSDWTRIDHGVNGGAVSGGCFAKIAAGSDTLTLTSGDNDDMAAVAIRVVNHAVSNVSSDITFGTAATGTNNSPDPPNCNPGSSDTYLWIAYFAADDDDSSAVYWSTDYIGDNGALQKKSAASTSSCLTSTEYRKFEASSQDPGTMTMAASEEWRAQTMAIPGAADAGFPVVKNMAMTADTTGNSVTVNMPSGIVAGEVLLVFVGHNTSATITQSGGSDWTKIDDGANGTDVQGCVFAKIAAGSDTLTITDNSDDKETACVAIRVSGHGVSDVSTDITLGTAATGNSSAPDPPNCNPGSADDFLWCEYFAADDNGETWLYQSASYFDALQESATWAHCAVGYRMLNGSAENPAAMDMNTSAYWRAQTLAIPPGVANTGPGLRVMGGT